MSRRLLMGGSSTPELPSKITFKVLDGTTSLYYNIVGTNVTLKDKTGTIIMDVANGSLPLAAIPSTTSDDVFTIEADRLSICNFQSAPRMKNVLEFTVPNKSTNLTYCFSNCSTLEEVRNITVTENRDLNSLFSSCTNLSLVDSFYVKPGVNANYMFASTKITNNPVINIEDIGDASGMFMYSMLNDLSSMQNKNLQWTNMSGFANETPITVFENLIFSKATYLGFNSSTAVTVRNIQAPEAVGASFSYATKLQEVSNVSIPSVINLYSAFSNCQQLTTVTNITTGILTNIASIFNNCYALVTVPELNVSPTIFDFTGIFESCFALTDVSYYVSLINNNTSTSQLNCSYMFKSCRSLNTLPAINFSKIDNSTFMFYDTAITTLDTITIPCKNVDSMFGYCNFLSSVNDVVFNDCYSAGYVFNSCPVLTTASVRVISTINTLTCSGFFGGCQSLTSASFNCTNTTTTMPISLDNFFSNCTVLTTVSLVVNNDKTFNTYQMFNNCVNLISTPTIDWSKVTNSARMFNGCLNLTSAGNFNLPICEDITGMFNNCNNLLSVGVITAPIVQGATELFNACSKLESVDGLSFASVIDVTSLFRDCTRLMTLGPLNFDIATNLTSLFTNCILLESVTTLTAPKAVYFGNTFLGCSALKTVTLNCPDVITYTNCFMNCGELLSATIATPSASVERVLTQNMFKSCSKLATLVMNLTKVREPAEMFNGCTALNIAVQNLTMNNFGAGYKMFSQSGITSISNVTINIDDLYSPYCDEIFGNCPNLTSINNLTITTNSTSPSGASLGFLFTGCTNLTSVTGLNIVGTANVRGMFWNTGITNLNISLPNLNNTSNCDVLVSNSPALTSITNLEVGGYAETIVNSCPNLTTVGTIKVNSAYTPGYISYFLAGCDNVTSADHLLTNVGQGVYVYGNSLQTINKITVTNAIQLKLETPNLQTLTEVVGTKLTNLSLFASNTKLNNYPIMNTSNVDNFAYAFTGIKATTYNDHYDLSNGAIFNSTFANITQLTSVIINRTFTKSYVSVTSMFSGCTGLTNVSISDASKFRDASLIFSGSNNITDLIYVGFVSGFTVPPLITDVAKLEALINSAGTAIPSENQIILGQTRLNSISTTVKNNAAAKGWLLL